MAVSCNAGGLVNDCLTHSDKPVEEGGFADVRSSYYCY